MKIDFRIIDAMQEVAFALDDTANVALAGLIKANIAMGVTNRKQIVANIVALLGKRVEDRVRLLIIEGKNVHFRIAADGTLMLCD